MLTQALQLEPFPRAARRPQHHWRGYEARLPARRENLGQFLRRDDLELLVRAIFGLLV